MKTIKASKVGSGGGSGEEVNLRSFQCWGAWGGGGWKRGGGGRGKGGGSGDGLSG